MNPGFTQYVGNPDYRGYLNYLGKQVGGPDAAVARQLLGLQIGNDAGFNPKYGSVAQGLKDTAQRLFQQYQGLNTATPTQNIGSIYGGGGSRQAYAPRLDIAAINAQARQAAENAVNPYYLKQLNEFLAQYGAQQGVKRQQAETQADTDIKNLQDQLTNTLQGNEKTRVRTGEDVAQNIAEVNAQGEEFQEDTGQRFEDERLALARQQAVSGTLGSGAGARQTKQAIEARNVQETRQVQKFQQAKQQQELFKGRTLEDLMKSDELAKVSKEKGEKQVKFDLDNYIQGLVYQEQITRNELEQERLKRIAQEQQSQAKLKFTQYLAGIKNPAQLAAAVQTYGGSF